MTTPIDRRDWLKTTTLALGSSLVAGHAHGAEAPRTGPDLTGRIFKALKGGKQRDETAVAFFRRLKALGFDGVESGNPAEADAYEAARRDTGVMVHGLVCGWHWKTRLSSSDAEVRATALSLLEQSIRDAHALGGSSILLVPGKVTGAEENHDHVWHRSIEAVRMTLPLASRLGVRILIETVWNGFCETPDTYRDYLDAFDSPWVGAYFDIGNMQKFAPAEEWIRTLGSRLVKLDIKDWGRKPGFCRLGEGDVDWDQVRTALQEIGFSGWATREGRDQSLEDTSRLIDQLLIGKR